MWSSVFKTSCSVYSEFIDGSALTSLAAVALVQCHFDYACKPWFNSIPMILKKSSQNWLIHMLQPIIPLLQIHVSSVGRLRVEEKVLVMKICTVHSGVK